MAVRTVAVLLFFAGIIQNGFSQAITINTPLPWVSLRNDSLVVRAQVDTGSVNGKSLQMKVVKVKKGKKSTIATKTFKIDNPAGEFSFGKLKKSLIGGDEYLQIDWAVKGTKEAGTLQPIGIADLSKIDDGEPVKAVKVPENSSMSDVAGKIGGSLTATGTMSCGFAWNKDALYAVVKKGDGTIRFSIDGKSGKNAFLSYPDRFVTCSFKDGKTVVDAEHYQREIRKDSLLYKRQGWQSEVTQEEVGGNVVIRIPWYDTGIIPFEDRTVGFGIFTETTGGKTGSTFPAKADKNIPATWGMLLLQK